MKKLLALIVPLMLISSSFTSSNHHESNQCGINEVRKKDDCVIPCYALQTYKICKLGWNTAKDFSACYCAPGFKRDVLHGVCIPDDICDAWQEREIKRRKNKKHDN